MKWKSKLIKISSCRHVNCNIQVTTIIEKPLKSFIMKKLVIGLTFCFCCATLFAQTTDSVTNKMNKTDTTRMNNSSNMNSNNMNNMNHMSTDTSKMNNNSNMNSANMNSNNMNNMSTDSTKMNNSSNMNSANMNSNNMNNMSTDSTKMNNSSNMNSANMNSNNMNNMNADSAKTNKNSYSSSYVNSAGMNGNIGISRLENPTNTPGMPGFAALPLLVDYVPDDVIAKLKSQFGSSLYSITTIKESPTENAYVVWKNVSGNMDSQTLNADGGTFTPAVQVQPTNQ